MGTQQFEQPCTAHLRGLHIMTDDPSSTIVVFTTDRSSQLQHRLNSLSDMIFQVLKAKNLVTAQNLMHQRLLSSDAQYAEVKLHATLMNTKYSKAHFRDREDARPGDRDTFDASVLMERFGGVDFGGEQMREHFLSSAAAGWLCHCHLAGYAAMAFHAH